MGAGSDETGWEVSENPALTGRRSGAGQTGALALGGPERQGTVEVTSSALETLANPGVPGWIVG